MWNRASKVGLLVVSLFVLLGSGECDGKIGRGPVGHSREADLAGDSALHRIVIQGWDQAAPGTRARFVLPNGNGIQRAALTLLAEPSVMYDRTELPPGGVVLTNVTGVATSPGSILSAPDLAATGGPSASAAVIDSSTSGAAGGTPKASDTHTHLVARDWVMQHAHTLTTFTMTQTPIAVSRTSGTLVSDAQLFIDGVDVTGSVTWITRNPTADQQIMLDYQDIASLISAPGVHWIEVALGPAATTPAGRVRFVIEAVTLR